MELTTDKQQEEEASINLQIEDQLRRDSGLISSLTIISPPEKTQEVPTYNKPTQKPKAQFHISITTFLTKYRDLEPQFVKHLKEQPLEVQAAFGHWFWKRGYPPINFNLYNYLAECSNFISNQYRTCKTAVFYHNPAPNSPLTHQR